MHITRNLPPLRGGMERLNQHVAAELSEVAEVVVIGPRGCSLYLSGMKRIIELPHRPLPIFFLALLWQSILQSILFRPQVVLAGSGLTAPFALISARLAGARLVTYLHGLDLVLNHFVYRRLWLASIRRSAVCLVNSRYTADLAAKAGIKPDRVRTLNPGVAMPAIDPQARARFRARFELGNRPLLLSVGRLTARKGVLEWMERSLPAIVAASPDALLLVIGDDAADALVKQGAGQIRSAILERAQRHSLSRNLRLLGVCDDETLSQAYAAADVHVFPILSLPGDVEGFGMVAIEAAAHGCPTVSFSVGGVTDAIAEPHSGALIAPGDYAAFSAAVLHILGSPGSPSGRSACIEFARGFAWPLFGSRLRRIVLGDGAPADGDGP